MRKEYFLPQLIVGKASLKGASHFFMRMFGKKNMTFLMLQEKNIYLQKRSSIHMSSSLA